MYILNRDPLVVYLEGFLQPGEAEHMIELAKPRMERSRIIGDDIYSEDRTSSSAYIEQSEDDIVRCIEERASRITNIPVESTEPLQVVWYTKGQEFRPHVDFLLPEDFQHLDKPKEHKGKHSRTTREMDQRYTTFLVYLNEPTEGGGTLFTELDMEILPKKNDAVLWYNMDINDVGDDRTMHGGLPVEAGEKYAINIWQCKQIPYMTSHFEDVSSTNSRYEEEKKLHLLIINCKHEVDA
ncbi:hypothetical protein BDF22DRAFT_654520 [Syncephalis plumigaleata]|nr:hypothetical protein BDF22DRAFT_654520 [Syncephalis plumigaleata]